MRVRATAAVLVIASALVVVGCSGSSDDGPSRDGDPSASPDLPEPIGEARDLSSPGFHELPLPPTPLMWDTARVWTGEELMIWGGVAAENDSSPGQVITEGATLDLADGRWTPTRPSPFPKGLYHPLAAFDGTEVIIIGTECDGEVPAATDGAPPICPKGPAAAAWDPGDGTWRTLPDPPIPMDQFSEERVINGGGSTASGAGSALFAFGYDVSTLAWDRTGERWAMLDAPWTDGTAVGVQVDPVTERLVAIEWDPNGGPPKPGPTPIWTLGAGEAEWRSEGTPVLTGDLALDTAADGSLVSTDYAADTGTVGQVLDLTTGEATPIEFDAESGAFLMVHTIGEWIFARPSGPDADTSAGRALRVDGAEWRPTDLPPEWAGEIYVDEGIIGTAPGPEPSFGFWRPDEELAG